MLDALIDYLCSFAGALVLTLLLTPLVREVNRRLGMVDAPDARRINKVPIPRGGGLALYLGVEVSYTLFVLLSGRPPLQGISEDVFWRLTALAGAVALLGLADDRFSLPPKIKLLGQIAIATLAWWWADVGFAAIWPDLPLWLDGLLTVFWIVGAVNAFNLIDGLDGLASGLALIATLGMAGALIFGGTAQVSLFYFAFAGGLLGFLRYNYNPASVFLGDCGSMYIGFTIAVLPLCVRATNSFLVSVGVPLLAMGVPIFDTALAILRRSIRRLLQDEADAGKVMEADTDHLHHRVMRAVGLSQRKAAWVLYGLAASLVGVGLVGVMLQSRTVGLWFVTLTLATIVIIKDLARIELFDAGRLLRLVAHSPDASLRQLFARLGTPIYMGLDLLALALSFTLTHFSLVGATPRPLFLKLLLVRVVTVFVCLVALRIYRVAWARAMVSNYAHLVLACFLGSVLGAAICYYLPTFPDGSVVTLSIGYALVSVFALVFIRIFRGIFRDMFYELDCQRLVGRKDVSRLLVYGAGLRYRAFRRELVRKTAANARIIVGILDDDPLLHGRFIGEKQVLGALEDAPDLINQYNVDTVVITCMISQEQLNAVREVLAPSGVRIVHFRFAENAVPASAGRGALASTREKSTKEDTTYGTV